MAQQGKIWEKTKKYSGTAYTKAKPGFDYAWKTLDKLGAPVNRLSNRLGAEAFWPTTLDKESDKAARILRSFCKDGFYSKLDEKDAQRAQESGQKVEGPQGKQRVLKKIPESVMRNAKGLAIFTTMRTGLWVSGAGGSGILIARHPQTGEWSPPSGILLHTAGLGFLVGVDIYDCVIVINTYQALEAFYKVRCTIGGEISAVAGPVGAGGVLDSEVHARRSPIWTYLKSRGFYAGVQVDGTIVIERTDENEKFYGERIPVADILAGKARYPPRDQYRMLTETLKAAQGEEVDESLLPDAGLAPSDMEIENGSSFGIPDSEDPDPYGVKALEAEGFAIREAGTHQRPSAEAFEFKPAPTSPIYPTFARGSVDSPLKGKMNNWRNSSLSLNSVDRGTQTDEDDSPHRNGSPLHLDDTSTSPAHEETEHAGTQHVVGDDEDDDNHSDVGSISDVDSHAAIETATPVVTKARIVSVPKRIPPSLPPRNPNRVSTPGDDGVQLGDGFEKVSLSEPPILEDRRDLGADKHISKLESGHTIAPVGDDEFHSMPTTPSEPRETTAFSEMH